MLDFFVFEVWCFPLLEFEIYLGFGAWYLVLSTPNLYLEFFRFYNSFNFPRQAMREV
jgi:hypothetical protein